MSRTWGSCTINARQTLTHSTVTTVSKLHTVVPQQARFSAGNVQVVETGLYPLPGEAPVDLFNLTTSTSYPTNVLYIKKRKPHTVIVLQLLQNPKGIAEAEVASTPLMSGDEHDS